MPRTKAFTQHDVERIFRMAKKLNQAAHVTLTEDGRFIASVAMHDRPEGAPPYPEALAAAPQPVPPGVRRPRGRPKRKP